MRLLAIDPGTDKSGCVVLDGRDIIHAFELENDNLRAQIINHSIPFDCIACEMIASYGMPVGRETFETCLWIGRFWEAASPITFHLVYRKDVKLHLCGNPRAKDGNIRQALLDKWGPKGVKAAPGPTYGISKHLWSALAIADYALEEILK